MYFFLSFFVFFFLPREFWKVKHRRAKVFFFYSSTRECKHENEQEQEIWGSFFLFFQRDRCIASSVDANLFSLSSLFLLHFMDEQISSSKCGRIAHASPPEKTST